MGSWVCQAGGDGGGKEMIQQKVTDQVFGDTTLLPNIRCGLWACDETEPGRFCQGTQRRCWRAGGKKEKKKEEKKEAAATKTAVWKPRVRRHSSFVAVAAESCVCCPPVEADHVWADWAGTLWIKQIDTGKVQTPARSRTAGLVLYPVVAYLDCPTFRVPCEGQMCWMLTKQRRVIFLQVSNL